MREERGSMVSVRWSKLCHRYVPVTLSTTTRFPEFKSSAWHRLDVRRDFSPDDQRSSCFSSSKMRVPLLVIVRLAVRLVAGVSLLATQT